jgi:hypothetical protein
MVGEEKTTTTHTDAALHKNFLQSLQFFKQKGILYTLLNLWSLSSFELFYSSPHYVTRSGHLFKSFISNAFALCQKTNSLMC